MSGLTHVELLWIEGKIERWIRFGRIAHEQILDRRRRVVAFAPGSVFAFARWASNDYGTLVSRVDILRACGPGEPCSTVPGVTPGGEVLLRISGWPKVQSVLAAVDAVDALGLPPEDACPDHWRHVHNRISAGQEPRPYARDRHRAWLLRREMTA
ncbi:DUF2840 domain-containing protein [Tistrella mobilis]|uniref:Glycosidase n=1 Tax=Tistrella mobilis (strain KA081020-065) TaxID=1110502 RepID=I3TMQ1_TISMK|nr:DUF2840 domain-containing protein [Tistrella mobilis]AFK54039.1 hypothetical protein TMO_2201 [Tistrella mobilis KA081020-065]